MSNKFASKLSGRKLLESMEALTCQFVMDVSLRKKLWSSKVSGFCHLNTYCD